MFGLGLPELLIIFLIVLMLFGASRLPQMGSALGKAIKNFKESVTGKDATRNHQRLAQVRQLANRGCYRAMTYVADSCRVYPYSAFLAAPETTHLGLGFSSSLFVYEPRLVAVRRGVQSPLVEATLQIRDAHSLEHLLGFGRHFHQLPDRLFSHRHFHRANLFDRIQRSRRWKLQPFFLHQCFHGPVEKIAPHGQQHVSLNVCVAFVPKASSRRSTMFFKTKNTSSTTSRVR